MFSIDITIVTYNDAMFGGMGGKPVALIVIVSKDTVEDRQYLM